MDYAALAREMHCLDTAVEDVTRRLEARFQGEEPTPQAVKAWLGTTLREAAPHLWPEAQTPWGRLGLARATFDALPVEERLSRSRAIREGAVRQRPQRLELTSAQVAELAAMPAEQRLSAYRQLQAQQGQG